MTSFILSINKSSRIATTIKTASRQIGTGDGDYWDNSCTKLLSTWHNVDRERDRKSEKWVKWDEYSTPQDIAESILEVVNDITRKHNFKIDFEFERDENLNFHVNIYEEKIKWKEKHGQKMKRNLQDNY